MIDDLVQKIGIDELRAYFSDAGLGETLGMLLDAFRARLATVTGSGTTWSAAFDEFECADAMSC